jgi:hypothetical protein
MFDLQEISLLRAELAGLQQVAGSRRKLSIIMVG